MTPNPASAHVQEAVALGEKISASDKPPNSPLSSQFNGLLR